MKMAATCPSSIEKTSWNVVHKYVTSIKRYVTYACNMVVPKLQCLPRVQGPQCSYKCWTLVSLAHLQPTSFVSPIFSANWSATRCSSGWRLGWIPTFCLFSLSMALLHMTQVSEAIWKWFCRCPDAIGHVYESSSNEKFFAPPTTPLCCSEEQHVAVIMGSPTTLISPTEGVQRLLSPSQMARLRRRHVEVV